MLRSSIETGEVFFFPERWNLKVKEQHVFEQKDKSLTPFRKALLPPPLLAGRRSSRMAGFCLQRFCCYHKRSEGGVVSAHSGSHKVPLLFFSSAAECDMSTLPESNVDSPRVIYRLSLHYIVQDSLNCEMCSEQPQHNMESVQVGKIIKVTVQNRLVLLGYFYSI